MRTNHSTQPATLLVVALAQLVLLSSGSVAAFVVSRQQSITIYHGARPPSCPQDASCVGTLIQHRSLLHSTTGEESEQVVVNNAAGIASASTDPPSTKKKRVALLVCPAQFCVPDDYDTLFHQLNENNTLLDHVELGTCVTAPLPRTEWIKVARQLPTEAFVRGALPVELTLRWYFDAIEDGLANIFAQEPADTTVCIIGHSIGGWVARAYLGGLSQSSTAVYREQVVQRRRISSLVTLGTPHMTGASVDLEAPPAGGATIPWLMVDQTRGLLAAIDAAPSCTPKALQRQLGLESITCVASSGLKGRWLSTNVEQLIAAASYLPQLGRLDADMAGDGIVPLELAFLPEPATRLVLNQCSISEAPIRHSHVVPTPWNLWNGYAPSIRLPKEEYPSYVTEGVVHQWAKYIR